MGFTSEVIEDYGNMKLIKTTSPSKQHSCSVQKITCCLETSHSVSIELKDTPYYTTDSLKVVVEYAEKVSSYLKQRS